MKHKSDSDNLAFKKVKFDPSKTHAKLIPQNSLKKLRISSVNVNGLRAMVKKDRFYEYLGKIQYIITSR